MLTLSFTPPEQETSKLFAALEKIPVFKSSRKASAGVLAEPSSSVNVPSSCNNSTQASLLEFLIFKIPVLVSAQNI